MEYKCGVCGEHVEGDLLLYINHTEAHILKEIQSNHPEWVEKDGVCQKCIDYYRKQMKGDSPAES